MTQIAFAIIILGILALAGWLVYFTGNLWCLLILLLAAGASFKEKK